MQRDARRLPVSTDSATAVALLDRSVESFLKFHADTPILLNGALNGDPDFVPALCFQGYLLPAAANPAHRAAIAFTLTATLIREQADRLGLILLEE